VITVTPGIAIDESEIREEFVRAAGPGGQNVNKVATAVQLRFDVRNSPSLPAAVRARLLGIAGRRVTGEGVLVIIARRHRTQEQNRREARARLVDLIRRAAMRPKIRRATAPTAASRRRRREEKERQAATKRLRRTAIGEED
jgi:ribosome-associated protein